MLIQPEFTDGLLSEYPRPQLKRDSYISLNGEWEYAFTASADAPERYDGKITVPYSPESKLSGVGRQLKKTEYLHYKKVFSLPEGFVRERVFVNFGACDQVCRVYLNGRPVGMHEGGYLPFSCELTENLVEGDNILTLVVTDDADSDIYGRGKQRYRRGGIWYTAVSGLWQSVWLESVPEVFVTGLRITPCFKDRRVTVECLSAESGIPFEAAIFDGETKLAEVRGLTGEPLDIDASACKPWTPDSPELYTLEIKLCGDVVTSYFGLRDFTVVERGGFKYFAINGECIYHNGLLDQGYWGDGIYTPASNKQMYDLLKEVKRAGFNMLRKHIKVEPMLWYYYCDVLGILVWQDMLNGGKQYKTIRIYLGPFINLHLNDKNYKSMGRDDPRSREQYRKETEEMISDLYSVVSLCLWTPFNEGWGQFDAADMCESVRAIDGTRFIDHASGWQDKGAGDVYSRHIYFRKLRLKNDKKRVFAVTEFGGYSYNKDKITHSFGYKTIHTAEELLEAYKSLYIDQVIPHITEQGLCGTVYTQLTDVEDETNGLFDASLVPKLDIEELAAINRAVYDAFAAVKKA